MFSSYIPEESHFTNTAKGTIDWNPLEADVKGITHVGIYVGNNMMIHAGDPIGFADLKNAQWAKKIYAFGRLPID